MVSKPEIIIQKVNFSFYTLWVT